MGEVYRARDPRLKRNVALKILPSSFASDRDRLARFQREAEVLASLSHPNIVPVYELGVEQGTYFLAMELVEGVSLAEILDSRAEAALPDDTQPLIAEQSVELLNLRPTLSYGLAPAVRR